MNVLIGGQSVEFCTCGRMIIRDIDGGYSCTCGREVDINGNIIKSNVNNKEDLSKDKKPISKYPNINDPVVRTTVQKNIDNEIDMFSRKTIPKTVTCPRCNSTQIQLVQRKWSLLTGFLTNKVDRVCLSCKHKF